MWRTNLLYLSAQLIGITCLIIFFARCEKAEIDQVPPALTLKKGTAFIDPVVQTAPLPLKTIMINSSYDKLLTTFSPGQNRPLFINGYENKNLTGIVQPIMAASLQKNEFKWESTGAQNVMVCLFKNVVSVDPKANEIANKADLVWLWTPPTGSTDPGMVRFEQGQKAEFINNQYNLSAATPLATGYYVWCVLAWDKQGINIIAASRELPILIR